MTNQNINTNIYFNHAQNYLPDKIECLFIAESPPAPYKNGYLSYIYFSTAKMEVLLSTLTTALFGDGKGFTKYDSKVDFLKMLKNQGYFLIDAVEYPINTTNDKNRELIIRNEIDNLVERLEELKRLNKIVSDTRIILIKKSVYNILADALKQKGFNILNDAKVDFPKFFNDRDTIGAIREYLKIP